MNSFKKFVMVAVLAVAAVGGVAVIDSPVVGTQRAEAAAPIAPWFAKVYYKGKAGYLGGYKTKADAIKYAQMWVRGVGTKNGASFRGEVIYNAKN